MQNTVLGQQDNLIKLIVCIYVTKLFYKIAVYKACLILIICFVQTLKSSNFLMDPGQKVVTKRSQQLNREALNRSRNTVNIMKSTNVGTEWLS